MRRIRGRQVAGMRNHEMILARRRLHDARRGLPSRHPRPRRMRGRVRNELRKVPGQELRVKYRVRRRTDAERIAIPSIA